jgi:hypothetical protein
MHASTGRGVGQAGAVSDSLITGGVVIIRQQIGGQAESDWQGSLAKLMLSRLDSGAATALFLRACFQAFLGCRVAVVFFVLLSVGRVCGLLCAC